MLLNTLMFNGKQLRDFGLWYDASQIYITPQKSMTYYQVVGRSGDLSIDNNRFESVTIPINCYIKNDFQNNFRALIGYLLSCDGYCRFEIGEEPDVYRMAQFVDSFQAETGQFLNDGSFTLSFLFQPQKWLKSGEFEMNATNGMELMNPTNMIAKPLLKVQGTGTIKVNGSSLTLSANTGTTFIDCDIQDAYEGTINRNGNLIIASDFPVLDVGTNAIINSGFTDVQIIPRWWTV